ncbi:MAG: hypothetical protein JEZ14_24615 [Marinilabiliaceae bacterium]|nr:hypothetical protein [Marinilabiliaceae bacterium]
MLWAIVNNNKEFAIPKLKGSCPMCEREVFSKCGNIKIWHWAHHKGESCEKWYEPDADWHLHWKTTFGKENSEIVIKNNDEKHLADIYTKTDVIIELQSNSLKHEEIEEKENFFGERMIWLINGADFKDHFTFFDFESYEQYYGWLDIGEQGIQNVSMNKDYSFDWKYFRSSWIGVKRPVFIDFKHHLFWVKKGMGNSNGIGRFISKEKFIKKYQGDYNTYLNFKSDFYKQE